MVAAAAGEEGGLALGGAPEDGGGICRRAVLGDPNRLARADVDAAQVVPAGLVLGVAVRRLDVEDLAFVEDGLVLFVERERLAPGRPGAAPELAALPVEGGHQAACVGEHDDVVVNDGRGRRGVRVGVHHRAVKRAWQVDRPQDLAGLRVDAVALDIGGVAALVTAMGGKSREEEPSEIAGDTALACVGERGAPHDVLVLSDAPSGRWRKQWLVGGPVGLGS